MGGASSASGRSSSFTPSNVVTRSHTAPVGAARRVATSTMFPGLMIYDNDADLSHLDGKTVAILGYGSQGHAHALNLKDSGVSVVVGLRPDSESVAKAEAEGLEVLSVADAASRGDVVMVLLPDERQHDIYESEIADGIAPGNLLLFAHGFAITYDQVAPGPGRGRGHGGPEGPRPPRAAPVQEGNGVPGLMAIEQDESGNARDLVLAYAKGIGCTRGGVIETTFKDETETDLFGEQAVLCGGVTELVRAGLRDAHRRRLRPAAGLLRVPARAEADRGPDVREGHHRHALLDLQHRRVRRPDPRQARDLRAPPARR